LNYVLHSALSLSTVSLLTGVIVTGKSQKIKIFVQNRLAVLKKRPVTESIFGLSLQLPVTISRTPLLEHCLANVVPLHPETLTKRQATQHGFLPSLLGNGDK
jgi:hypothetical protein